MWEAPVFVVCSKHFGPLYKLIKIQDGVKIGLEKMLKVTENIKRLQELMKNTISVQCKTRHFILKFYLLNHVMNVLEKFGGGNILSTFSIGIYHVHFEINIYVHLKGMRARCKRQ